MIAVSDGKYAENGHNTSHIYNAIGSYNYGAMYRLVYGTLLYRNGTNLVLKTKVDTALGQTDKIEIADFSDIMCCLLMRLQIEYMFPQRMIARRAECRRGSIKGNPSYRRR